MKDYGYYESLPYHAVVVRSVTPDGEVFWRASLREIAGLSASGATEDEALMELRERFEQYILWRLDLGLDIPEPE